MEKCVKGLLVVTLLFVGLVTSIEGGRYMPMKEFDIDGPMHTMLLGGWLPWLGLGGLWGGLGALFGLLPLLGGGQSGLLKNSVYGFGNKGLTNTWQTEVQNYNNYDDSHKGDGYGGYSGSSDGYNSDGGYGNKGYDNGGGSNQSDRGYGYGNDGNKGYENGGGYYQGGDGYGNGNDGNKGYDNRGDSNKGDGGYDNGDDSFGNKGYGNIGGSNNGDGGHGNENDGNKGHDNKGGSNQGDGGYGNRDGAKNGDSNYPDKNKSYPSKGNDAYSGKLP